MKKALWAAVWPTTKHTLELFAVLVAVFFATKYLGLPINEDLLTLVLAAIVAFSRKSTKDYVNV